MGMALDFKELEAIERMGNIDYSAIGRRVRKYRKEMGYTQDNLAELVHISTTHMSHIETGSTKLSLEVFAALANALHVGADALLHDMEGNRTLVEREISGILKVSSLPRLMVYYDMIRGLDDSVTKHYERRETENL